MIALEQVERINKDLKESAKLLGRDEARFLVDAYYMMQDQRKRTNNQLRALTESEEPNEVLFWLFNQSRILENQVKRALDAYSASQPAGIWARSIVGIGPVIAAGLLAHIDITKAATAGAIWRFAGLDPSVKWGKGEKRPWNAALKTLCWKIGESFTKNQNREGDIYGQIYAQRKALEIAHNDAGVYAEQAEEGAKRVGKKTESYKHYKVGKLPPGHIHMRAQRYAVKLFLAHLHEVMYVDHYKTAPPLPYAIAQLGHAHKFEPPAIP